MTNSRFAFPWTDENIATLTRLWRAGMSGSLISKEMGWGRGGPSRNAVIGKLHRMGLTADMRQDPVPTLREPNGRPPRAPQVKREPVRYTNARAVAAKTRVTAGAKIDPFNAKAIPLGWKPDTDPPRIVADVSHAKPWLQRGVFECTWIVSGDGADAWACCAPIHGRSWCKAHYAIGTIPFKRSPADFVRGLRRFAA